MKLSADRKRAFLAELARHGIVSRAARAASPGSENGATQTFRDERYRDAAFALAWEDALEIARGEVEAEVRRRAVEGWEEPVYQQGAKVGTIRRYDSRLLELHAKRLIPEYRDRTQVAVTASVEARVDVEARGREVAMRNLTPDEREQMYEALEKATDFLRLGAERAKQLPQGGIA